MWIVVGREEATPVQTEIPSWAMRAAGPEDRELVGEALGRGTAKVDWPDRKALRDWARRQGWPTPWLDFEPAFLTRMLAVSYTHLTLPTKRIV